MGPSFLVVAFILGGICAVCASLIASSKKRDGCAWALAGFLFGPLALLTIGFMAPAEADDSGGDRRKCPQCAEYIKREALVCRFCGCDLQPLLAEEERVAQAEAAAEVEHAEQERMADEHARAERRVALETRRAKIRSERESWQQSHKAIGWIPVRSTGQLILSALLFIGLVSLAIGVPMAVRASQMEAARKAAALQARLQLEGALSGYWNRRNGGGWIRFAPDPAINRGGSLTILPSGATSGHFLQAKYESPSVGSLILVDDSGVESRLSYEIVQNGVLLLKTSSTSASPVLKSVCGEFER